MPGPGLSRISEKSRKVLTASDTLPVAKPEANLLKLRGRSQLEVKRIRIRWRVISSCSILRLQLIFDRVFGSVGRDQTFYFIVSRSRVFDLTERLLAIRNIDFLVSLMRNPKTFSRIRPHSLKLASYFIITWRR